MKNKLLEKLNTIKKSKSEKDINENSINEIKSETENIQDIEDEKLNDLVDIEETNKDVDLDKAYDDNVSSKDESIISKESFDEGKERVSVNEEIDDDTLKAKKLIEEENMDVIEALEHLDKMDEAEEVDENANKKKAKDYLNKKLIPICICFFITAMVGLSALLINMSTLNISIIVDDEKPVSVKQIGTLTTSQALAKAGISPSSKDTISKPLDAELKNNDVINITSADKVLVTNGKKIVKVDTGLTNKKDIVKQANFKVDKNKKVSSIKHKNTSVYAVLDKNQKLVNKTQKVKYKTVYKEVDTLDGEDEKVVKEGQNGKLSFISVVTTNSKGKVVNTTHLTKTVVKPVQNKIVEVAKDSDDTIMLPDADGKAPVKYNQKITVNVTAYCGCAVCCGKSTGRTASGTYATANRTIAAWSGLPFGTKVYFPSMANRPNGGIYTVEDRGGAITSGRIDIYFSSHSEALAFGRRAMDAYILK